MNSTNTGRLICKKAQTTARGSNDSPSQHYYYFHHHALLDFFFLLLTTRQQLLLHRTSSVSSCCCNFGTETGGRDEKTRQNTRIALLLLASFGFKKSKKKHTENSLSLSHCHILTQSYSRVMKR